MTVGYKKAVHAAEFFMKVPAIDRVNLYDAIVTRNKNRYVKLSQIQFTFDIQNIKFHS